MNRNKVAFLPTPICALVLIVLIIIHVIPVPLLEPIILYVVLNPRAGLKKSWIRFTAAKTSMILATLQSEYAMTPLAGFSRQSLSRLSLSISS
jgi:hypothetical protein